MSVFRQKLELIAESYHLNSNVTDMHLENKIQIYESHWVRSKLQLDKSTLDLGYGDGVIYNCLYNSFNLEIVEGSSKIVKIAREKFARNKDTNNLFSCLGACGIPEFITQPFR